MNRKRRLIIVLLSVVPLLVLVLLTGIYVVVQVRSLLRHLDVLLVDEISRATGRAVLVGRVDASRLGHAVVYDLRIANGETFDSGTLLRTRRVVVDYRWVALVTGGVPAVQTVQSVRLTSPAILLERLRTGRLNVSDLLAPRRPPGPPFLGVVTVEDGSVAFRDWLARLPGPKPAVSRFVEVDGSFDAAGAPFYVYHFTARGAGRKTVYQATASGSIDTRRRVTALDVRATDAAVAYWWRYFLKPGAVNVLDGRADASFSIVRRLADHRPGWRYAGAANVRTGRVSVTGFRQPASDVHGAVRLADGITSLKLSAKMAGNPLSVEGTVIGFAKPRLKLTVASGSADYARVLRSAEMPAMPTRVSLVGRGPLTVNIIGPSDNLVFGVGAVVPAAEAEGFRARDVNIQATYANRLIEFERVSAGMLDGRVLAQGRVALADGTAKLSLSGTASNIQLASIPQLHRANVAGRASGEFAVTGTTGSPVLKAHVQVSRGTLSKTVLSNADAQVVVSKDRVGIRRIAAGVASGVVQLAGSIGADRLDLDARAVGLDLRSLLKPFGLSGYSGIANLQGRVFGSTARPTLAGEVEVFQGRFQSYEFDYARGEVEATPMEVSLRNAVVRALPAEVAVSGRIAGIETHEPTLDLTLGIAEAPADRILSLLKVEADVAGTVSGNVTVRGRIRDIEAQGSVTLVDGTVEGYRVAEAHSDVAYAGGVLRLADLTARSDGATVTASGTVDRRGELAFTFAAKDISLVRLSERTKPYAVLSGMADVSGWITGMVERPSVDAMVASTGPVINTVRFDSFGSRVAWDGRTLGVSDLSLRLSGGELAIARADYDLKQNTVAVEGGRLTSFAYPALYTVIAASPYLDSTEGRELGGIVGGLRRPTAGTLTASFSAAGPANEPQATFELTANQIDVADIRNVRLQAAGTAGRGLVELKDFRAAADALNVEAHGTLIADGRRDLEVDAYNVDLAALTPATGPTHVTGTATVRASIKGLVESPLVTASVEMVDPVIYGIAFDRLSTGEITVDQNRINLTSVMVAKDGHSGLVYDSKLPWDWAEHRVPLDQPIELHARMEEQTLGILALLTDWVDLSRTSGRFSAKLDVSGTVADRQLAGGMTIADGTIGIGKGDRLITDRFTDVKADLAFTGDAVQVKTLSGRSDGGGTFEVVPGGTISLRNLVRPTPGQEGAVISVVLRMGGLYVGERNLLSYKDVGSGRLVSYNERVSGRLTTGGPGLAIAGPVSHPRVSGTVNLADTVALLGPIPERGSRALSGLAFNPQFDLTFVLGNDVWFSNQSLKALMQGDGHLGGTLSSPIVTASLHTRRGTIGLPPASLSITRGDISVAWRSPEPALVTVDLRAQAPVTAASPTGTPKRYTIVMTVQGSLSSLQPENVDLRSEPPGLTRTQMLAALGHFEDIFGSGELALRQQLRDIFTAAVTPRVLGPLESAFIEALGLEEFNIEYGFEQPLALFVSRRLFNRVYVSYWQIVTGATSITGATYSLRVTYRVRPWLDIGWATDSRRIGVIEAAYSKRFH